MKDRELWVVVRVVNRLRKKIVIGSRSESEIREAGVGLTKRRMELIPETAEKSTTD